MSGFDTAWLDLREPYDSRSLNVSVLEAIQTWARGRPGPLHIFDLGSGTGAAYRHLHGRLPDDAKWTVVDDDPTLLAYAAARTRATSLRCDLSTGLAFIPFADIDLVCASAFIDLVSAGWLDKLIDLAARHDCAVWFPMAPSGERSWSPHDPFDARMNELFTTHQAIDKGFGQALGAKASRHAEAALAGKKYRVTAGDSDWKLTPGSADLQFALLHGYRDATLAIAPGEKDAIDSWTETRRAAIEAHASSHTVGHRDIFAVPS